MKHFSLRIKADQESIGLLPEQNALIGRDDVVKTLKELLNFENKKEKRTHCKLPYWKKINWNLNIAS